MDAMHTWDDARLLADRERPADTFAVFFRRHVTSVLAFYARRNVEVSRAAHLTAAVFESALRQRGRTLDGPGVATWLHGLATERLADDAAGRPAHGLLRARRVPRVVLDARDRAEYSTLAFGPFDVLDLLADRPRPRTAGARSWSGALARHVHAEDPRA
jgi:DNA-directed RNA polymerase specialized sigma24 family protein